MTEILTTRALNRATLARQMLLDREKTTVLRAVERLAGLQAQLARPPFIGLWSRLEGFRPEDLTRPVHARKIVRATLMRGTLHLVTTKDYRSRSCAPRCERRGPRPTSAPWATPSACTCRSSRYRRRRDGAAGRGGLRGGRKLAGSARRHRGQGRSARARAALPGRVWPRERARRRNMVVRAGPRRYLRGAPAEAPRPARRARTRAVRPAESAPTVCRHPRSGALPADYDNLLLAHADRTRVIADAHRSRVSTANLRTLATFLVDGFVAGVWRIERKRTSASLLLEPFAAVSRKTRAELIEEGEALVRFVESDARTADVRFR